MNTDGIMNTLVRGEVNSLAPNSANVGSIENTNNVYYLHGASIPAGVMARKEMADLTREEVQLRIENSEAKNDTKIVRLESKLDLVLSKLDAAKSDNLAIRTNQWVIAFGLALLIIAVVALFPVFFSIGTQIKDMVDNAVQTHLKDK
jgi:hypothetical protein